MNSSWEEIGPRRAKVCVEARKYKKTSCRTPSCKNCNPSSIGMVRYKHTLYGFLVVVVPSSKQTFEEIRDDSMTHKENKVNVRQNCEMDGLASCFNGPDLVRHLEFAKKSNLS